ncbi:MAG: hypothetical protein HQK54_08155 [Oligoflexales bacterium]|nr:hypothetical protein [Oligoflexales bacterium]
MLKQVYINKKKIPVPIPIATLGDALQWIEHSLLPKDNTITKIRLDEKELDVTGASVSPKLTASLLSAESRLEVQIDNPLELSIQTIDALRNLIQAMIKNLKPIAVDFWQTASKSVPSDVNTLEEDLELTVDLFSHLAELIDLTEIKMSSAKKTISQINQIKLTINMAKANSDWKGIARILLNKLNPTLSEFNTELSDIQKHIFEMQTLFHARGCKFLNGENTLL